MVYMPFNFTTNLWAMWCFFVMLMRCMGEVLRSMLMAPCRGRRSREDEVPELVHMDTPFHKAVIGACPALERFRPAWWARGPHAQTLAMALTEQPDSQYRREMFSLPSDGVQVALDWKEPAEAKEDTPLILCLHGMGGCSNSQYLRVFTDCAMRRGYRAVVYNRRGHGNTSLLPPQAKAATKGAPPASEAGAGPPPGAAAAAAAPGSQADPNVQRPPGQLPGSCQAPAEARSTLAAAFGGGVGAEPSAHTPGSTPVAAPVPAANGNGPARIIFPKHSNMEDMVAVVEHLQALYPKAPMYLIGFSCGANLAVNYLAHTGPRCPFIATASVSNGYDIWNGTSILTRHDPVSDGVGAQFLKGMLLEGRLEECQKLAAEAGVKIDWDAVMKAKSVQEIEALLVVPAYGYGSLQEYYDGDSCHACIQNVHAPLLCVCCRKDPLVHSDMLEVPRAASRVNPHILTVITKHGGHMGWITKLSTEPWYLTLYFQYIEAVRKMAGQVSAGQGPTVQAVAMQDAAGQGAMGQEAAVQAAPLQKAAVQAAPLQEAAAMPGVAAMQPPAVPEGRAHGTAVQLATAMQEAGAPQAATHGTAQCASELELGAAQWGTATALEGGETNSSAGASEASGACATAAIVAGQAVNDGKGQEATRRGTGGQGAEQGHRTAVRTAA